MELLKQIMMETVQQINVIAEQIVGQKFLSEQDFLTVLSALDRLRKEQSRCLEELSGQTGMDLSDCTSLEHLEQRMAQYQEQCQQKQREKAVLALAEEFARIVGEGDYGFALESFQQKLLAKTAEELLEMEDAGQLNDYRLMLELLHESGLTIQQVEPISRTFDFHVAFGLLGGKYACMKTADEPVEVPAAVAEPEEEVPAEEAVPEELPEPEAVCDEGTVQEAPVEDVPEEPEFPLTELPALMIDGSGKKPKGESSFISIWRKCGMEQGIALQSAAYMILEDWGCRKNVVHRCFENSHSQQVIDRAMNMLMKEGFLNGYRLEGEDDADVFYNITGAGHQIMNKESLQRKVRGRTERFGCPDIAHAGVFARLRRMNDIKAQFSDVPDGNISRFLEGGFSGSVMYFDCEEKGICHFPMLYTGEDKPDDIRRFLDYFKKDRSIGEQSRVLLEVPEGQQEFWLDFFARELSPAAKYYVSAWEQDAYVGEEGGVWTLEELLKTCMPVAAEQDATAEPQEEAPVQRELVEELSEELPAETIETEVQELEQLDEEEGTEEDELLSESQLEIPEDPEPEIQSEEHMIEPLPLMEEETVVGDGEDSLEQLAQKLAKLADPDENPDALMDMIRRLTAEGQTMEALVLAKTLTGVSKDPRFQKIAADLLHGSNLPLQDRDYSNFLIQEDAEEDHFGWYSLVSAAFWAACFPKMAYDHGLYLNISSMVESQMDMWLPDELVSVKNALACLTGEMKEISFEHGDGAGLSAAVLDLLTSGAVQEARREKLMRAAKEKLNAPHSNISITGLETLMRNTMGPTGELGLCMKAIAEDDKSAYSMVRTVFEQFTKDNGSISDRLINSYIDDQWDYLRKVKKEITLRRFDNESPARKALQREISKRLENMDEWLKRNSGVVGGGRIDQNAIRAVVHKIQKTMDEAAAAVATALSDPQEPETAAGLRLLYQTLRRILAIISGDEELSVDPKKAFVGLLTSQYPIVDDEGYPVLDELLNTLPGMEPWRLMLQHLGAKRVTLEEALQEIEDHELHSVRYEDYGSAAVIRSALGLAPEDRTMDGHYAQNGCMDQEKAFMGDVRMACAYGQLAEEDKETIFAQLARYRNIFLTEQGDTARYEGNYGHYRMMIECLKEQVDRAKVQRKAQFWQFYEERARKYAEDRLPSMLRKVRQELEKESLATAEEYLIRFDAEEIELPQENVYAAEFNFHNQYLECADWFCSQCEKPENKNRGPRDWGRRVLQSKNFWAASNERNSAEVILENWPNRKGDSRNPMMLRVFLREIGLPVQRIFSDTQHPATSQYEVFLAEVTPVESGRKDYPHPVAKFGTQQERTMHIVCLYGCKGAATLIDIMTKKLQLGGNTIVIMDGVVNVLERRRVAAQFKTMTSGQNGFLLIDRVLMLYLAALDSGNRPNAMLQCTMPYIYEQLYTEGAGRVADEMFMGRITERKSLCDRHGACLVYGGRQLGKTALLRRVESINNKPADRYYAIYLDIKEKGRAAFIEILRQKLLTIPTESPLLRGDEENLEQICASLTRNQHLFKQLTVLIDEVDVYFAEIAQDTYNDIHPVVVMQDELENKVKFVFAGTHNVAATSKAIENNADIIKLRQPLCIKPLSSADAMQLIRWPLSYLGFEIGEQQIAMILANTNSYPGLIHLFCNSLVKSICDNYSKYYGANKGNPPYTVSDEQLRTIFREKDIKREIATRVIATIKLNSKYRVVANLIAFLEYQAVENGTTRLYGFTPEEVQLCNVREFGIEEFMPENIGLNDLDALMAEMEKMGILWKNPRTGSYRFRQRDFLGYIGNYNQVMNALLGGV